MVACYLIGALAVTGRLWADPAGRMQVGDRGDVDLFAWFMRYAATAVVARAAARAGHDRDERAAWAST